MVASNQSFVIFYGWNPSDSYLMTPPVKLEGGKLYHFRYSIRSAGTYDTERFGCQLWPGRRSYDLHFYPRSG